MKEALRKQLTPVVSLLVVAAIFYGAVQLQERNKAPYYPDYPGDDQTAQNFAPLTYVAYEGVDGKTAAEVLKSFHTVETQEFPGVGEFVSRINGVPEDTSKYFWAFYVNGEMAQVGASQYVTKSTDFVEWKLEEINY